MSLRDWFQPPRQLLTVLLTAALVSTGALGWLTWQLIARDRIEARDSAANAAAQRIDRQLAAVERRLAPDQVPLSVDGLPAGAVSVVQSAGVITVSPPGGLPYFPDAGSDRGELTRVFSAGEDLELIQLQDQAALQAYRSLMSRPEPKIRATALTRMARIERRQQAWESALEHYDSLETYGNVSVDSMPARLVARLGRTTIFEHERPDRDLLRQEAARLAEDLANGRLQLTKAAYGNVEKEVRRWLGAAPALDADALIRAEAFGWLWTRRNSEVVPARGRRFIEVEHGIALALWQFGPDTGPSSVVIFGPAAIRALIDASVPQGFSWALTDLESHAVSAAAPPEQDVSASLQTATGLPGTLYVFPSTASAPQASARSTLLLLVLLGVAGMLAVAWYFIWRGISREARVARLHSDFVAAVSHEFRSPLTSMRHIAEMLAGDRMPPGERRTKAHSLLLAETDRLARLVEGLLDFGRLQHGGTFTVESVDVRLVVEDVIADFSHQLEQTGHRIDLTADQSPMMASVDREGFRRVLWNLLDNAVKYSPPGTHVQVAIEARGRNQIDVSVSDQGLGIPHAEQRRIFDRFVRGDDAKARRIRGTGIGLAMAREIVRAHGGELTVESEHGKGSTFTVALHSGNV